MHVVHNFIRIHSRRDLWFEQYQVDDLIVNSQSIQRTQQGEESSNTTWDIIDLDMSRENISQMVHIRDHIADQMWANYSLYFMIVFKNCILFL